MKISRSSAIASSNNTSNLIKNIFWCVKSIFIKWCYELNTESNWVLFPAWKFTLSCLSLHIETCLQSKYRVINYSQKPRHITSDSSHPSQSPVSLLPSGRQHCAIRSRTRWLRDSFYPMAIGLLNVRCTIMWFTHTSKTLNSTLTNPIQCDHLFHSRPFATVM